MLRDPESSAGDFDQRSGDVPVDYPEAGKRRRATHERGKIAPTEVR